MPCDPWEDPAMLDAFLCGRPEEEPDEEDWNDDVHDQHLSDGDMDDQIAQWRSDGIDEDTIRGYAGSHYREPKTIEQLMCGTAEERQRARYMKRALGFEGRQKLGL